MQKKDKKIFSCILLCVSLVFSGCLTLTENDTIKTPEATPMGQWAGLAYEAEGWELITYEGYEKNSPSFPQYMSEMQILIHPKIEGCELTYWYGGTEYLGSDWDF